MLMRLRQGLTFEYLGILFQTENENVLIDIFYEVSLLYYNSSSNVPRAWATNISNERKSLLYQNIINDMDPLYTVILSTYDLVFLFYFIVFQFIANNWRDPLNKNRLCYMESYFQLKY